MTPAAPQTAPLAGRFEDEFYATFEAIEEALVAMRILVRTKVRLVLVGLEPKSLTGVEAKVAQLDGAIAVLSATEPEVFDPAMLAPFAEAISDALDTRVKVLRTELASAERALAAVTEIAR